MKKNKLPTITRDIKDFLSKEEGDMTKKDAVKMGMGLMVLGIGLGSAMKSDSAMAGTCDCCNPNPCGHCSHASHASHGSHASHASHSSY